MGVGCKLSEKCQPPQFEDKYNHLSTGERERIATCLRKEFPEYDVVVCGSISMDITPKGCGKEQIAYHLRKSYPNEKIIFFGDKTFVGGNDYELAQALSRINNTEVIQVKNPSEVLNYLSKECNHNE